MPVPGRTSERGYGADHKRARARWRPLVEAGQVDCWRCGRRIHPRAAWDLGHDDHDRGAYRGPEHAECNRRAGALLALRGQGQARPTPRPRAW